MKTYVISHVSGAPDWSRVPSLALENCPWLPNPGIAASAQIAWDADALRVHLRAQEREIRAEHTEPLSMVCEDSCLEFFFRPDLADERYFNFEANPNGRMYIGVNYSRAYNSRQAPNDEDALFAKDPRRCADGWEIFYRIPWDFVRLFFPGYVPSSGRELRANCFKCGDLTPHPHYMSWNPCTSETPDFHQPRDFGRMILE
jgi:hypothetical protein